jgi:C4-dicarboxylate transporter
MAPLIALLVKSGLSLFAGAVASKGSEFIKEKTGIDLQESLGTEEGRLKLKELEMQHQELLINAAQASEVRDLDYFKEEVKDRDSARSREVEIAKISGAPWYIPNFISWLTLIVTIGGGWMFINSETENSRLVICSIVTMVLSYYYGTTRNSGTKDSTLASALDKLIPTKEEK